MRAQTWPGESGRIEFQLLMLTSILENPRGVSVGLAPIINHEGKRGFLTSSFIVLFLLANSFIHSTDYYKT